MAVKPIPEGYHSITPYLIVTGAGRLLDFVKQAFGATDLERMDMPDGTVMHAEARIGDSLIMMGEAGGPFPAMPASLYLYVNDVDATYRRAIQAGGSSVEEPNDKFYGDRSGGVKDPSGNIWWIATRKEEVSPEEMRRRAQAAMAQRQAG